MRDFAFGCLETETLGVLDLQPLVDHLAQYLGCQPLTDIRTILQTRSADRENDPLGQLEIGDGVVIDARHDAQRLGRHQDGHQDGEQADGDRQKDAEEQRGH